MFHVWGRFLEGRQGRGLSGTEPWGSVKLLLRSKVTAPWWHDYILKLENEVLQGRVESWMRACLVILGAVSFGHHPPTHPQPSPYFSSSCRPKYGAFNIPPRYTSPISTQPIDHVTLSCPDPWWLIPYDRYVESKTTNKKQAHRRREQNSGCQQQRNGMDRIRGWGLEGVG